MPNSLVPDTASLQVQVISSADPNPNLLRAVRSLLHQREEVRQVFLEANNESEAGGPRRIDRQRLSKLLSEIYPEERIDQVAEFLSDEFEQIGDGILLISPDTGKAIAKLSQDSLYEANPVPRESGTMVERGWRIRPDIEAFIAYWSYENEREVETRREVISRLNQTELQREEGDPRTLILSKRGRKELTQRVHNLAAETFSNPKGSAQILLQHFPIETGFSGSCTRLKVIPWSRVRRRIQDQLSVNPKYDPLTATSAAVASSWARSILGALLEEAVSRPLQRAPVKLDEAIQSHVGGTWICDPNLAYVLKVRGCNVFPVIGPANVAVHLSNQAGYLELVKDRIGTNHRELHDRWVVESATEVILHICWECLDIVHFLGDFTFGISVEPV
jgi:hypothetical protein